jgi:uncharacterized protein YrrD
VADFVINADLGILIKIYVERLWGKSYIEGTLIIPANKIISIERKRIIITDNALKEEIEEQEAVKEAATT